jgi:hypothetical protein
MSTASCRPVPGRPSKHGANIDAQRSRPLRGPLPVKVQLPATSHVMAAPGVRRKRPDTVSDPCGQLPGLDPGEQPRIIPSAPGEFGAARSGAVPDPGPWP